MTEQGLTKKERIQKAIEEMRSVEEFTISAAISALMNHWDIDADEAQKIVYGEYPQDWLK